MGKNDSSSNTYIFIDYFKIFTDETPTPDWNQPLRSQDPRNRRIDAIQLDLWSEDVEGITAQKLP